MTNKQYWILASLGGNNQMNYTSLYYLVNHSLNNSKYDSEKEFLKDLSKHIEYGLIDVFNKKAFKINLPTIKFALTSKGSNALDYYKYCRYRNSNEAYKLKNQSPENISYNDIPK